jgi:hypothetical protein
MQRHGRHIESDELDDNVAELLRWIRVDGMRGSVRRTASHLATSTAKATVPPTATRPESDSRPMATKLKRCHRGAKTRIGIDMIIFTIGGGGGRRTSAYRLVSRLPRHRRHYRHRDRHATARGSLLYSTDPVGHYFYR